MAKVLLLLDMANLWDSCRAQYGKRARVNFKVLIEKSKGRKADTVFSIAFITRVPDKNQDNLGKKLNEMGMNVCTVEGSEHLITCMDAAVEFGGQFDKVVFGTSNPAVKTVVVRANQANKETMLLAFAESLDKELAREADDVKLLSKQDTITQ